MLPGVPAFICRCKWGHTPFLGPVTSRSPEITGLFNKAAISAKFWFLHDIPTGRGEEGGAGWRRSGGDKGETGFLGNPFSSADLKAHRDRGQAGF